jgi:hypothetical protein
MSCLKLPAGWTSPTLDQLLPEYSQKSHRILEIGSFIGRSTALICQGIQKSKLSKVRFDTCDLHFKSCNDFRKFYLKIYGKIIKIPDLQRYYINNRGTYANLCKHLEELNLSKYVKCHKGCFIDLKHKNKLLKSYNLIYCSVSHDVVEINYNIPSIGRLLDQHNSVLIADDINSKEQIDAIVKHIDFTEHKMVNNLFIGIIKRPHKK